MSKARAWRHFNKRDGRWYRKWREPGSRKIHQQLESRWVWEQAHGPIPDGHEIHHKNHDHADNRIDNLECVIEEWHNNYHQRLREAHRMVAGVEERRCQRCHEWKPTTAFYARTAGTYHGYCKQCGTEYMRTWREKNREHWLAYKRSRYPMDRLRVKPADPRQVALFSGGGG